MKWRERKRCVDVEEKKWKREINSANLKVEVDSMALEKIRILKTGKDWLVLLTT